MSWLFNCSISEFICIKDWVISSFLSVSASSISKSEFFCSKFLPNSVGGKRKKKTNITKNRTFSWNHKFFKAYVSYLMETIFLEVKHDLLQPSILNIYLLGVALVRLKYYYMYMITNITWIKWNIIMSINEQFSRQNIGTIHTYL